MISENKNFYRFRLIVPSFPEHNIFDRVNNKTTALGPLLVATSANKLKNWQVEIIDENNYRNGPLTEDGKVDHQVLQKENPADVVGFYCGLSSTIPRVWELARFYKNKGALTLAGGWHVKYKPQESLEKGIDVIVNGDGEDIIQNILEKYELGQVTKGEIITPEVDLDHQHFPDFGLLRFAKIKIYPIGRVRGCSMRCEFCSVKGKGRFACGQHLFEQVKWLIETRKAKDFFIVDDRLEEDKQGTIDFFNLIKEKYNKSLNFIVQVRLEAARDKEFLQLLKDAGVSRVCIGYESPIDEELMIMRKGVLSKEMIELTHQYLKYGFFVHGMFIFGYPLKNIISNLTAKERIKRYKSFIKKARIDSIQILRPVPLVGSDLRERLQQENKLLPLEKVGWEKYDGNYACFIPQGMTFKELQEGPTKIMTWFYNWRGWVKVPLRTLAMPFDYTLEVGEGGIEAGGMMLLDAVLTGY